MPSTSSASQDDIINLYSNLMEEAKTRVNAISARMPILQAKEPPPTAFIEAEFCFLQVRLICEIIALASSAAHSPLGLRKNLLKSWHAERTFEMLSEINPNYFPKPVLVDETVQPNQIKLASGEFLSVNDVQRIYNECGSLLHRGVLKHALSGKPKMIDVGNIHRWTSAFVRLLSTHLVSIKALDAIYLVNLGGPDHSVQVYLLGPAPNPTNP